MKRTEMLKELRKPAESLKPHRIFLLVFVIVFANLFSFRPASAQSDKPADLVPPPLSILTKAEKNQLDEEENIKKRTQLAIELMESRLSKASEYSSKNQYRESLDELGGFQAILRNAFRFLKRNDNGSKKVLNNFKRFEINLRQFIPRLELIRREMPIRYAYHVQTLMKHVRETRSMAVEPLFDDSVLPEGN